eukprot:gene36635-46162_t
MRPFVALFLPTLGTAAAALHAADQYAAIASRFSIFTVEKAHAAARTNSVRATVGTARKIKALNESVKVLMYWNAALNFNFYECESE